MVRSTADLDNYSIITEETDYHNPLTTHYYNKIHSYLNLEVIRNLTLQQGLGSLSEDRNRQIHKVSFIACILFSDALSRIFLRLQILQSLSHCIFFCKQQNIIIQLKCIKHP